MHCMGAALNLGSWKTEYLTSIVSLCIDTSGYFADLFALVCGKKHVHMSAAPCLCSVLQYINLCSVLQQ